MLRCPLWTIGLLPHDVFCHRPSSRYLVSFKYSRPVLTCNLRRVYRKTGRSTLITLSLPANIGSTDAIPWTAPSSSLSLCVKKPRVCRSTWRNPSAHRRKRAITQDRLQTARILSLPSRYAPLAQCSTLSCSPSHVLGFTLIAFCSLSYSGLLQYTLYPGRSRDSLRSLHPSSSLTRS